MAEKSRVLQLEEELSLRRGEIQELQQCLLQSGPPPQDHPEAAETLRLRERLLSASKEHQRDSSLLQDKYEKMLKTYQAEVDKLRTANEKYAQEVADLKAKVQQATSENMGLMDNWKSKLDSLASDHQKSLEDLKATLNSGPGAQQKEIGELKALVEGIKMEHQLELGNLQAKHDLETAMLGKEKEGLRQKLQEAQEELAGLQQHWRAQLEEQASQHRLELQEAQDQCRDAQLRVQELEGLDVEYRGQAQAIEFLKEQISLAEKKMLDFEMLQREGERLREKLLVAENRLQAVESLCSAQHSHVGCTLPLWASDGEGLGRWGLCVLRGGAFPLCLELAKRGFRGSPSISLRAMLITGNSVVQEDPVWFFIDRHRLSLQGAV